MRELVECVKFVQNRLFLCLVRGGRFLSKTVTRFVGISCVFVCSLDVLSDVTAVNIDFFHIWFCASTIGLTAKTCQCVGSLR